MNRTGRKLRRFATLGAGMLALAIGAVGCGIPLDESPRAMGTRDDPDEANQVPAAGGDNSTFVYLVLDGQLVPVRREVAARSPGAVLGALTRLPTPDESATGLVSQLPEGTTILGSTQNGDVLNVDLSSEFENVVGSSRQQAIGQLVYTATELAGINELTFSIDGIPLRVSSSTRGDVERVMDCDFRVLLPTDDWLREANVEPDSVEQVGERRRSADGRCPQTPAPAS